MQDDSTTTYRVARIRCGIIHRGVLPAFGLPPASGSMHPSSRRQPHTAWGGRSAPVGALPPYPPKVFFSTLQRETHINSNHKKQLLQLGKNISPTRKIEKQILQILQTMQTLQILRLGTESVRRRYGEGLG